MLFRSLLSILQKLLIFRDCKAAQVREVLKICVSRSFKEGDTICKEGEESDSMFVILSGTVEIHTTGGMLLVSETAVTSIGEAGMLTGELRSATVVAQTDVKALAINRRTLMPKLSNDPLLASLIYRNVLYMVRSKLIASNQRICQLLQDAAEDDDYVESADESVADEASADGEDSQ